MATPKPPQGNPALRMMGIPNIRMKLPSRNWSIFLTTVGALAGTITYDRMQAKKNQQKWISAVSHLSRQPLPTMALPRKVTIYISAPPGDGLSPAREHWEKYIKPILVAAAVDYDVVEGRAMGEVRWKVAEEVRTKRKAMEGGWDVEVDAVEALRKQAGIEREGEGGVVVVGRHAWKEWVRGVHEGWLGPLMEPLEPVVEAVVTEDVMQSDAEQQKAQDQQNQQQDQQYDQQQEQQQGTDATPEEKKEEEKKPEEEPPKKPALPNPFISTEAYSEATLPPSIPSAIPTAIIPFPHILGFFNTPLRFYRFVTRRYLTDDLGREAAAIAFGAYSTFNLTPKIESTMMSDDDVGRGLDAETEGGELGALLEMEEGEWPRRVWKEEKYKGVWTEEVKVDPRVAGRFRRFVLPEGVEEGLGKEGGAEKEVEL